MGLLVTFVLVIIAVMAIRMLVPGHRRALPTVRPLAPLYNRVGMDRTLHGYRFERLATCRRITTGSGVFVDRTEHLNWTRDDGSPIGPGWNLALEDRWDALETLIDYEDDPAYVESEPVKTQAKSDLTRRLLS